MAQGKNIDSSNTLIPEANNKCIIFNVTESMSKAGIKEFVFTLNNGRKCCVAFLPKMLSISELIKVIDKKLYRDPDTIADDPKVFTAAINDIEDQIIKKRDEIFVIPNDADIVDNNRNASIPTYNKNIQENIKRIKSLRCQCFAPAVKEIKVKVGLERSIRLLLCESSQCKFPQGDNTE
ncbi:MAG: hypothetical protein WA461_10625 [Nitrososphaeraceae archaeon]